MTTVKSKYFILETSYTWRRILPGQTSGKIQLAHGARDKTINLGKTLVN